MSNTPNFDPTNGGAYTRMRRKHKLTRYSVCVPKPKGMGVVGCIERKLIANDIKAHNDTIPTEFKPVRGIGTYVPPTIQAPAEHTPKDHISMNQVRRMLTQVFVLCESKPEWVKNSQGQVHEVTKTWFDYRTRDAIRDGWIVPASFASEWPRHE